MYNMKIVSQSVRDGLTDGLQEVLELLFATKKSRENVKQENL